jgi:SAM-dependent methyltransferase
MTFWKRALNRIGRPFGINPYARAFENPLMTASGTPGELFDEIFHQNYWGSSKSKSGVGSEEDFVSGYRRILGKLIEQKGFLSVFDAPCGDVKWISKLIVERDLNYTGGDISPAVIAQAKQDFPALDLRVFDLSLDKFPCADVWHCRDCLFHLPFNAIKQIFENFAESETPYALITSHRSWLAHKNLDVGFGGFRYLDLERAPFSLPPPELRLADFRFSIDFPRYVCLWSRPQIASSLRHMY